jgi:superfamily II DNA or RNA helicase
MNNSKFQLRDYQADLVSRSFEAWKVHQKIMLQLPTGGGKTVIFSEIAQGFMELGIKVLILAHRNELILQAAEKLRMVSGGKVGIVKAGIKPNYDAPVQVASVQSLARRLNHFNQNDFGLIIIDEAHHTTAKTYRAILDHFPRAKQLGVTATPIRTNGEGFNDLFDHLITGPTVGSLIEQGYLSKFQLFAAPTTMITKGARTQQGDFLARDVANLNKVVELSGDLIQSYRDHANNLSCVVFAVNVEHSQAIADRYNSAGITAAHLDGKTSKHDRDRVLEEFRARKIKVVSNVGLFTEGLDIPHLGAVQIARPTKSLGLWLQMVGRVLRPSRGKTQAVILDHTQNHLIHGLPSKPRIWTLNGVENPPPANPKAIFDQVSDQQLLEVLERLVDLYEVKELDPSTDNYWDRWLAERIEAQQAQGFKKSWLGFQLKEACPPSLDIWIKAGIYMDYKPAWAKINWQQRMG